MSRIYIYQGKLITPHVGPLGIFGLMYWSTFISHAYFEASFYAIKIILKRAETKMVAPLLMVHGPANIPVGVSKRRIQAFVEFHEMLVVSSLTL